jgi:hypothetical protein
MSILRPATVKAELSIVVINSSQIRSIMGEVTLHVHAPLSAWLLPMHLVAYLVLSFLLNDTTYATTSPSHLNCDLYDHR